MRTHLAPITESNVIFSDSSTESQVFLFSENQFRKQCQCFLIVGRILEEFGEALRISGSDNIAKYSVLLNFNNVIRESPPSEYTKFLKHWYCGIS